MAGGIIVFHALSGLQAMIPYVLAISAASFIYIALADILPGLNRKFTITESAVQTMLLCAGIGTIAAIRALNG